MVCRRYDYAAKWHVRSRPFPDRQIDIRRVLCSARRRRSAVPLSGSTFNVTGCGSVPELPLEPSFALKAEASPNDVTVMFTELRKAAQTLSSAACIDSSHWLYMLTICSRYLKTSCHERKVQAIVISSRWRRCIRPQNQFVHVVSSQTLSFPLWGSYILLAAVSVIITSSGLRRSWRMGRRDACCRSYLRGRSITFMRL